MSITNALLLTAAIVIILLLSGYAWYLTRRVNAVEKRQQDEAAQAELQIRQRQQSLVQDIHFMARSVLEEQCEITEGMMRLHYLISALDPVVWEFNELEIIRKHHTATSAMPILDAYKDLSRKEQFVLDRQRYTLENEHKSGIERELHWLLRYPFPGVTLIQ